MNYNKRNFNKKFNDMFKLNYKDNSIKCNTSKKRSKSISPLSKKKKGGTRKKKRKGGGTCTSKPIATPLSHETPMLIDTPDKQALAFLICKRANAEVIRDYYPNSVAYIKTKSKKGNKTKQKGGDANDDLINAIEDNNYNNVEELLNSNSNGININFYDLENTPLIWAIINNNIEIVQLLLNKGANIEAKDYQENTPLIVAAIKNNIEIVQLLLDNGAKIEATNDKTNTALMEASIKGNVTIVELLLDNGADINEQNKMSGFTPLIWATTFNQTNVVKKLLERGANIEITSKNGKNAIEHGRYSSDSEIVKLLKKHKYLTREPAVLEKYIVKKDDNLFNDLNGFETISMDPINYCEYIENDKNNLIFIYNGQYVTSNKNDIRDLIINDNSIVFECNNIDEAYIPKEDNIINKPYLNLRSMGIIGVMVPLAEIEYVLDNEYQIYIINNDIDDTRDRMPIASLNTRIVDPKNSGQSAFCANHCQAEVYIKKCNLSYIENNYLLKKCSNSSSITCGNNQPSQKKQRTKGGLSKRKSIKNYRKKK